MSQQEKNLAICYRVGWELVWRRIDGRNQLRWVRTVGDKSFSLLVAPDHFNDLNAMHEAEGVLTDLQQKEYCTVLDCTVRGESIAAPEWNDKFYLITATAAQRAEAFGKTLSLW